MTLTIKIEMDNAAFEENPGYEAGRILINLAADMRGDPETLSGPGCREHLFDLNGNKVGEAKVTS